MPEPGRYATLPWWRKLVAEIVVNGPLLAAAALAVLVAALVFAYII